MKIGFETITWGIRLTNIEEALDVIAEAGYQGVEFAQRVDALGVSDIDKLLDLLRARNLHLLGLVGGTLKERMEFCKSPCVQYLYVEPWELEKIPVALEKGFTPALHPRVFTTVRRVEDIINVLNTNPQLKLLLDTAHIKIAGDDPANAIQRFRHRLAAVHLKDWTPEYGRSSYRYGRGFTELGNGIVDLDTVLKGFRNIKYDGWLVAEVDKSSRGIQDSVVKCAEWLAKHDLLPTLPKPIKTLPNRRVFCFPRSQSKCLPEKEARFREAMMFAATEGVETFYEAVAEALNELIPCKLIQIWTYSPTQNHLALLTCLPKDALRSGPGNRFKPENTLTGIALYRHAPVTYFNLDQEQPGGEYGFPDRQYSHLELKNKLALKTVISLPIYNSGNQNYARLLINLFPIEDNPLITDDEWYCLGRTITASADLMLDRLCSKATVKVNMLAGQSESSKDFLENLKELIKQSVNCEGLTIFIVNQTGDRLEQAATTGIHWKVSESEQFYRKREGLTGKVWDRNEPLLTVDAGEELNRQLKSEETVPTRTQRAGIWVPFVNVRDEIVGVVRCRNKSLSPNAPVPNMFSDDDAAILDSIGQAAVPHLQILNDDERRTRTLTKLTHELKVPLVAIRGAAEFMLNTQGVNKLFEHNYPSDVWSWSELMRRILGNADIFRSGQSVIPLQIDRPVKLMGEVIAPAVKQVEILIRERRFSPFGISYDRFESIPGLWIDRNYFQQIIFNLLSNAIKYCFNDPDSFQVKITGQKTHNSYEVYFCDWGPGIDYRFKELIFEEGFRTPEAIKRNISGDGLGLWVVRRLVESHGGQIKLTNLSQPTRFTIYLPESLSLQNPTV